MFWYWRRNPQQKALVEGIMRVKKVKIERPNTFHHGKNYLLLERGIKEGDVEWKEVIFLAYAPSAGQIVVRGNGKARIVYRRNLFLNFHENENGK
jgi:hypothetical protein